MFGRKSKKISRSPYKADRKRPFIDVMSEIGAGPLWLCTENDDVRMPVDPEELPITKSLATDLSKWQAEMDSRVAGPNPDFHNLPELPANYVVRGEELAKRLIAEIGNKYDIKYVQ